MRNDHGRRKIASIIVSLSILFPDFCAAASQFEARMVGVVRPLHGLPTLVKPVDFHAIPGLDAAIKFPTTLPILETSPLTLPTPAVLETTPRVETSEFAPQKPAAGLSEIAKQVGTEIEAAGSISDSADGDASTLGAKLQKTIGGGSDDASGTPTGAAPGGITAEQNKKLAQLKQVVRVYTEHYAPIDQKAKDRHVNFLANYEKARAAVIAKPGMTQHEFQVLLADFVAGTQDYHAGITFYSTEKASLALMILSAQGKHYIAYVDRSALPKSAFPYAEGDEVVKIGGKDVAKVAASFTKEQNTLETDARLAEMRLTNRSRRSGVEVPQGPVELTIKADDGTTRVAKLDWTYHPEVVPTNVPTRGPVLGPETDDPLKTPAASSPFKKAGAQIREMLKRFLPTAAHPQAGPFTELAAANPDNGFMIGGKKTYVPELGKVVWELPPQIAEQIPFVVKIYEDASGRKIGYLRIPDYMGGGNTDAATQLLEKLVEKLQAETDGLVIDQVNNPGGDMFFMNDLASMLTTKPLTVAKHRLMIGESDAALAARILQQASDPGIVQELEEVLHEMMEGFQRGPSSMLKQLVDYAEFILSELKAGRRLTDPTYIFGVQKIQPHPSVRYTKPIIVLINELDFSAADFFPALMQDNGRATLFGVRTAGAGGAVKAVEFPNQYGIEHLAYTWTIAIRPNGKTIENNGVQPDEKYEITRDDLRGGFAGYAKALGGLIAKLFPTGTAGGGGTVGGGGEEDGPRPPRRTPGRRAPRPE